MRTAIFTLFLAGICFGQNPLMQAYMPRYDTMKNNLVEAAEAMPAEHYGFKLTPAQRAFGEWVDHTVLLLPWFVLHDRRRADSGDGSRKTHRRQIEG